MESNTNVTARHVQAFLEGNFLVDHEALLEQTQASDVMVRFMLYEQARRTGKPSSVEDVLRELTRECVRPKIAERLLEEQFSERIGTTLCNLYRECLEKKGSDVEDTLGRIYGDLLMVHTEQYIESLRRNRVDDYSALCREAGSERGVIEHFESAINREVDRLQQAEP